MPALPGAHEAAREAAASRSPARLCRALLLVGGLLRWIRHLRNNDVPLNACIALLLLAIVAVPALKRLAPHVYRKRRTAVLLVIRLVMAGCAAVATALPGQPAGVVSFVWMWAVGSNAAISFFIPQAWMLPSWLGAGLFVLHQAALAHLALARCDVLPRPDAAAQAAHSFVAADRFGALEGITCLLDWPLFVLAPQASLQGSGLSPAGECLATTLWLQVTSALIAPAILLHIWSNGGKSSSSSRGSGSSSSRGSSGSSASYGSAYSQPGQLTALRVLTEWVEEQPVQMGLFLSMMSWLALRAAMAYLLPA